MDVGPTEEKTCTLNDLADNELRFIDMDLLTVVQNMINVFKSWCYRRMLRISWTEHATNEDVFNMTNTKPTPLDGLLKSTGFHCYLNKMASHLA